MKPTSNRNYSAEDLEDILASFWPNCPMLIELIPKPSRMGGKSNTRWEAKIYAVGVAKMRNKTR